MPIELEEFSDKHREWARRLLEKECGSTTIVSRGRVHDALHLPGFVATSESNPIGLVTYRIGGANCEIVTLNSTLEGKGAGSRLIDAVKGISKSYGCKRLWLITTNDNMKAVRFYQKRGFTLVAVHRNALETSRKLKPEIPLIGIDGIPLRDEIELEMLLY